jgi:hypothetical protein
MRLRVRMSPVMPLCSLRIKNLFMRVGENALDAIRILLQQFISDHKQIAGYFASAAITIEGLVGVTVHRPSYYSVMDE